MLHVGPTPKFDESLWDFKVFGEVEKPLHLRYREFLALPSKTVAAYGAFGRLYYEAAR